MSTELGSLLVQLQRPDGSWLDVGHLSTLSNTVSFTSIGDYWEDPNRPTLGQQFEDRGPTWRPSAHVAAPRWFSHLLPQGRLRQAVSQASGIAETNEWALLARIGADDLPGAVRLLPADSKLPAPPPDQFGGGDDEPTVVKFSLAGLQMKFSLVSSDRGLTLPASGQAGDVILKLPDPRVTHAGVPEAEHAAMTLASAAGVHVAQTRLIPIGEVAGLDEWSLGLAGNGLAVSRYDRASPEQRIHAEEFAQILDVSATDDRAKYRHANFETVARVAAGVVGVDAVSEVIDRLVVNVLVGNGDAHLKNWSVVYPDGVNAAMSPAYDIVPTVLYMGQNDLGLKLNGSRAFTDVTADSFARLGEVTGMGQGAAVERAVSAVDRVLAHWSTLKDLLPAEQYERLTARLSDLPLTGAGIL